VSKLDMPSAKAHHIPDVVGLGHCAYDILAITPGLPEFDDVKAMHLAGLVYDGGGQVGTALTTLARLGTKSAYIGLLGDDDHGHFLKDLFVQEKVDTSRLRMRDDVGTNICLILVEQDTGRRAMFCHRRVQIADLVLGEADRETIRSARVLHLDGQFTPAAIQAAYWAREAGVRVCFDGNHPRPGLDELLPLVSWLVVAESFPATYTGHINREEAARALLSLGAEVLIVTQGKHGCQVWTAEDQFQAPGFDVTALDTTGAGDAFHGAFLHAMLQGWDLHQVASFANAVAAINCQTLGGRRGLPTLSQVEAFLAVRQD
jgi:sugar/nucleoside kinase (ribokinase family)